MSRDAETPQTKGGRARADALTQEQRKEIARNAALARWEPNTPRATHEGAFNLGNARFSGAVLPNGLRLLTQATFLRALGRSRSPKAGTGVLSTVEGTPFFLQADILQPFISEDLLASTTPIFFIDLNGRKAVGYDARLLPNVADVYLKYRDACLAEGKPIAPRYANIIRACDAIMRGLATVGIVALVDEATGYQDVRDRQALQAILDLYLRKEFAAWAKTFPDDFYKEIFRLKKWQWMGMQKNRPQIVGRYTIDLVYSRLAPGIVKELRQRNPKDENGYRKSAHHQWLTADVGHPRLAEHLYGIIGLMRAHDDWDAFMKSVERAYPKRGPNLDMFIDQPAIAK
jgi:hypothetical protein